MQGSLLSIIITATTNNNIGKAVNFGQEQVPNIYICCLNLIGALGLCPWIGTICAWNKASNKSLIVFSCVGYKYEITSRHDCMHILKREIN